MDKIIIVILTLCFIFHLEKIKKKEFLRFGESKESKLLQPSKEFI